MAMIWLFARFDGRIGREVFWLGNIFLVAVLAVLLRPSVDPESGELALQTGGIGFLLIVAAMISSLAIGAKRLHDMNASGFFAVFLLVKGTAEIKDLIVGEAESEDIHTKPAVSFLGVIAQIAVIEQLLGISVIARAERA